MGTNLNVVAVELGGAMAPGQCWSNSIVSQHRGEKAVEAGRVRGVLWQNWTLAFGGQMGAPTPSANPFSRKAGEPVSAGCTGGATARNGPSFGTVGRRCCSSAPELQFMYLST